MLTGEQLLLQFPNAPEKEIKQAIKYQDKFSLTLDNLKCLNPECNNIRKWSGTTTDGFNYCCSNPNCYMVMKKNIITIRQTRAKQTYLTKTGYENPFHNPIIQNKIREDYLAKTGYENPSQNPKVKQKSKQTYLAKTGYEHPALNPEVKQKKKETHLERTGYDHPLQNPKSQQKFVKTCLLNYGVTNPLKNKKIRQKLINTCLKKYGVNNVRKSFEIKNKIRETYLERTGYNHNSLNPETKIKRLATNIFKYNTTHYKNKHLTNFEHWDDKQFWVDNFLDDKKHFDYLKCMKHFNCSEARTYQKIKELDIKFLYFKGMSLKEQALYPLLDDLDIRYETNTKAIIKPMELDIWLPDLKLAIEYNGSYWHSYHPTLGTSRKQTDYNIMKYQHQQKSLACYNAGIRLLHIYEYQSEDEVLNNLENFLLYDPAMDTGKEWDLDTGCYPLGLEYTVMEPESRNLLKDRVIWGAGKIK